MGRFQYFAHQSLAQTGAGTLHLELWKFWEETNVGMRLNKEAAAAMSCWDCKRLLAPGNRVSGLRGKQGRCCPLAGCDTGVRDLDLNWPENLQMKRGASSEFWQCRGLRYFVVLSWISCVKRCWNYVGLVLSVSPLSIVIWKTLPSSYMCPSRYQSLSSGQKGWSGC